MHLWDDRPVSLAEPNFAKARSTSSLTTLRRIGSNDEQSFCSVSTLRASTITLAKAGRFLSGCPSSPELESNPLFSLVATLFDLSTYLACILILRKRVRETERF
uniref:Calmodulin-binding protein 60 D n=1 Tax=Rhizophora mucronata TaxID=61149 RepID=A0A2P2IIR2_RHIMU